LASAQFIWISFFTDVVFFDKITNVVKRILLAI